MNKDLWQSLKVCMFFVFSSALFILKFTHSTKDEIEIVRGRASCFFLKF